MLAAKLYGTKLSTKNFVWRSDGKKNETNFYLLNV